MTSKAPPTTPTCTLGALPDELLLRVLSFLDIPELLSTSRVCAPPVPYLQTHPY